MFETFAALLLAHALADFVLQNEAIALGKQVRKPLPMAAHIAIVYLTAAACMGHLWNPYLAALAGAHLIIDVSKSFTSPGRAWPFLADQLAHLLSLAVLAFAAPTLWAHGVWADLPWLPATMATLAGALLASRAGFFALALILRNVVPLDAPPSAIHRRRAAIWGQSERAGVFLLGLLGLPLLIGIAFVAKLALSISQESAGVAELRRYAVIGTVMSFGWAVGLSMGTMALLGHLPDIGLPLLRF